MAAKQKYKTSFGFIDLLFNLVVGFVFLFVLAFILINPVAKRADFDPKAEYLVILTWPDGSKNDIDIWVQDNMNNTISFRNRDKALINLDRDDLGESSDAYVDDQGRRIKINLNREVVSIKNADPREYYISVHFYKKKDGNNREPVEIEVIKINPYKIMGRKRLVLEGEGDEQAVYRLSVKSKIYQVLEDSDTLIVNDPNMYRKDF